MVQEVPDKIVVRVAPAEGAEERVLANRDEIAGHITDRMGAPFSVEFAVESDIEPTRTGKHLYTVSKVSRA